MSRLPQKLRFSLILWLAGDDAVVLNATLNHKGCAIFVPHGQRLLARNVVVGDLPQVV